MSILTSLARLTGRGKISTRTRRHIMGNLLVGTFVSLDGVMQAPGGPDEDRAGGFTKGGWLGAFFDEETGEFVDAQYGSAGGFLLGRKTYEIFANFWPKQTGDDTIPRQLNTLPK